MRTLKKSLCLVLALVFVLGLCTVGSNAAFADKYSDAADVTADYTDAIEVLTGLQIIEGYTDGTFGPSTNVTRAEAAAMIARMMLGREAADKLPVGEVKFSDVPEDSWAAKYIAFCANKGIIVGMGNGTFCPKDNVTGTQLAAMLLRALGYDAMGEYQGKGWDINAVADALYYGVFNDSKVVDFNQPATREETALYIWNTMWINLVGYDVDLNYYKEKERLSDGKVIGITFADDAFDLEELSYDSKTKPNTYVVLANQATGSKYTVVGYWGWTNRYYTDADGDGKYDVDAKGDYIYRYVYGWKTAYYLDAETPLELIGHEVTVYIDTDPITDEKEHVDYFKTYLIKDESTVMDQGKKLDDFYRAAKAANKDNLDVWFGNIKTLNNYDYLQAGWFAYTQEKMDKRGNYWPAILDGDDSYPYYQIFEVKGQMSSKDGAPDGEWILDHAGNILLVLMTEYRVAKVTEVDTLHEEIELDVYDQNRFIQDGAYDLKWNDIQLVEDGLKKNDYVTVEPVGELFYVYATTTDTADITQIDVFGQSFNNGAFPQDDYGYGILIPEQDWFEDVGIGDNVKFYMTRFGTYFGLQVLAKAKTDGICYVTLVDEFLEHSDWDKWDSDISSVTKVQCINQDGEELVYKFSKKDLAKGLIVTDGISKALPQVGVIYEVRRQGNTTFFNSDLKYIQYLENEGKTNYLRNTWVDTKTKVAQSDIYYVNADTKVIYWTGVGSTLDITVSNKLAAGEYPVAVLAKPYGGSFKLNTVWVLDESVKAPKSYIDESILYVRGGVWSLAFGKEADKNGDPINYYFVFVDGKMTKAHLSSEQNIFFNGGGYDGVFQGFYRYTIDEDGTYVLTMAPYDRTHQAMFWGTAVTLIDGSVKNGRLFAAGSDGVDLKGVTIYDVSSDAVSETKKDASVMSLERMEELLEQGYTMTVEYMYTLSYDDNNQPMEIPYGVMYVTDVVDPEPRT